MEFHHQKDVSSKCRVVIHNFGFTVSLPKNQEIAVQKPKAYHALKESKGVFLAHSGF